MPYTSFGELGYRSLYLPSVAYYYLWSVSSDEFELQLWSSNLPFSDFFTRYSIHIPRLYLLVLTVVTLVGAVEVHGLMRSLFGREGPAGNPKIRGEAFRRIVAVVLWKDPDYVPQTRSKLEFALRSVKLIEGKRETLRMVKRITILIPAFTLKHLGYFGSILILSHLVFGEAGFVAGLISFSLFTLFFRDWFWGIFPTVQPSPGETGLVKAEFERDRYESTGRNLGERLKKNSVSVRYRANDRDK